MCVCVSVCVEEGERVCVGVCVCVRSACVVVCLCERDGRGVCCVCARKSVFVGVCGGAARVCGVCVCVVCLGLWRCGECECV